MPEHSPDPRSPEFLDSVRDVLLEAALAVQKLFETKDFRVASKGEEGPVTSADLLANFILRKGLSALLPNAGWLSEETTDSAERLGREYVWIVDPIDGTREFVKGIPEYSVSVGLARAGDPVLGAVALPADRRIVYGERNLGVFCASHAGVPGDFFAPDLRELLTSSEPAAVEDYLAGHDRIRSASLTSLPAVRTEPASFSSRAELSGATTLVSASEYRRGKFESMKSKLELKPSGSIARKLALVAAGEGDLNVSLYPKNEWDICGGTALIRAWPAGRVIDLERGRPVDFNQENPRSLGLAAGPAGLVEDFALYFKTGGFTLETSYS